MTGVSTRPNNSCSYPQQLGAVVVFCNKNCANTSSISRNGGRYDELMKDAHEGTDGDQEKLPRASASYENKVSWRSLRLEDNRFVIEHMPCKQKMGWLCARKIL